METTELYAGIYIPTCILFHQSGVHILMKDINTNTGPSNWATKNDCTIIKLDFSRVKLHDQFLNCITFHVIFSNPLYLWAVMNTKSVWSPQNSDAYVRHAVCYI